VRSDLVVINALLLDGPTGILKRFEPVEVEALVPEPPAEALDVGVLVRLSRTDETQFDASLLGPAQENPAGELRALVEDDGPRQAVSLGQLVQEPGDTNTADRSVEIRGCRHPRC
jgi:hypothetical protein